MLALTASELLDIWECGQAAYPFERAQALLEAAYPSTPPAELVGLTVGERDRRLLALREATFGSHISAVARCAACTASLELAFHTSDIMTLPSANGAVHRAELGGFFVEFRLPTGRDLAEADLDAPGLDLLRRCTIAAHHSGGPIDPAELPDDVVDAVVARMAEADPQARVDIAVACPTCGGNWDTPFDVVSYFWTEIDSWAGRTLREVHTLASAYGWREADILAMSPHRRRSYLELAG